MEQAGEKTEQATPRRLEEAIKRGQFPRSAEVQTVFVLGGGLIALMFTGRETWKNLADTMINILGKLHEWPITFDGMQHYFVQGVIMLAACVWPVAVACILGGLLAGGIQSRFQTASEALEAKWEKVNPFEGLKKIFSMRGLVAAGTNLLKLTIIIGLTYSEIRSILNDPIFYNIIDAARIASFMAESAVRITMRVGGALIVIASLDYGYQYWQSSKDMMMTKEEVKEEAKNSEGNPQIKAAQRRRRSAKSFRKMLAEVPKADVIVTNPTHFAVALRYDRKTMKAPRVVAKGSRLHALQIRELAKQHQVPIIENKPLARMMFKHCKVGGEIPADLYQAVAEVLAWVYRVNRYRYYAEQNLAS